MSGYQKEVGSSAQGRAGYETQAIDAEELYTLGLRCAAGHKGRPDYVEAHKWFNLAAMQGLRRAAANRTELAQEMTPADIACAQRAAREWLGSRR